MGNRVLFREYVPFRVSILHLALFAGDFGLFIYVYLFLFLLIYFYFLLLIFFFAPCTFPRRLGLLIYFDFHCLFYFGVLYCI